MKNLKKCSACGEDCKLYRNKIVKHEVLGVICFGSGKDSQDWVSTITVIPPIPPTLPSLQVSCQDVSPDTLPASFRIRKIVDDSIPNTEREPVIDVELDSFPSTLRSA